MATIDTRPDNVTTGLWWLIWIEREEVVGRVTQDSTGMYKIVPEGPQWSPMKSFGRSYPGLEPALSEVQLYFERR
jgi:hypothetical protein